MAKKIPDAVLDAQLAAAVGNTIHVTSAEPANYAGIAAVELASGAIGAPTTGAGDVSGRKNAYPAVSALSITATDTATHVCLSNGVDTLTLVTTCTSQALTSGGTVDTSAFDHEIAQAT